MASRSELVVHLEDPDINVKILHDQSCQSKLELHPVLNIVGTHRNWNVAKLENTLSTTLGRIDDVACRRVWLSTHDWDAQLDRQLDVVLTYLSWDDVCLLAINQVCDLLQSFW